jgi:triacylglycerol lipase
VRYQCTASMSPRPTPRRFIETVGHPWRALSLALFTALHRLTSATSDHYPCAALQGTTPFSGTASEDQLVRAFGSSPTLKDNDGVVPLRSQLWGALVWAGHGDHLDVLGHCRDDRDGVDGKLAHRDWLTSGSGFSRVQFAQLMDAIAAGMLMD